MKKLCVGFALGFALLTLSAGPGAAQAQALCNVWSSASNWAINFGPYTGSTVDQASPGNLQIRCTTTGNSPRVIHLCVGLGVGMGGGSVDDRLMKLGSSNNTLHYQLYRDSARTQVFGAVQAGSPIDYSSASIAPQTPTTITTNIRLYGRLPGNQTPGATGNYQSQFNEAHVSIKWIDSAVGQAPTTCDALTKNLSENTFAVQAQVQGSCTVNVVGHVNFGQLNAAPGNPKNGTGSIRVTCTGGSSSYKVEMRDGLYAQNNGAANAVRHMRHASLPNQYVAYELYRDPQRTQRWGRISNSQYLEGNCSNTNGCIHNVYARTNALTNSVRAGNYEDTVAVVVEY